MTITTEQPDVMEIQNLSGQRVHVALLKGKREHQNDRLKTVPMPGCERLDFSTSLGRATEFAKEKLNEKAALLAGEGLNADLVHEKLNSCTSTLVGYKPKAFTLDVASVDDSPALLILDDGRQVRTLMITAPIGHVIEGLDGELTCRIGTQMIRKDGRPYTLGKFIALPDAPLKQTLQTLKEKDFLQVGSYRIGDGARYKGQIHIQKVVDEAVREFHMDATTLEVHLAVGSDGLASIQDSAKRLDNAHEDYPTYDLHTLEFVAKDGLIGHPPQPYRVIEEIVSELYIAAKKRRPENMAQAMAEVALQKGADDNLALTFVPNLEQKNGEPMVIAVNDAGGKKPALSAPVASDAIEAKLLNHKEKALKQIRASHGMGGID